MRLAYNSNRDLPKLYTAEEASARVCSCWYFFQQNTVTGKGLNNLSPSLKGQEKEEYNKPNERKSKEIINIRIEINDTKNRKTRENP